MVRPTKHGACVGGKTKAYGAWAGMKHAASRRGDYVHDEWRASFEAFRQSLGDPEPGQVLQRIDPNGDYVPGNVRWSAAQVGMRGMACALAKLTDDQVRAIHRARGTEDQKVTAARYGVTTMTVSSIQRGKVWRHVTGMERLPPICKRPRRTKATRAETAFRTAYALAGGPEIFAIDDQYVAYPLRHASHMTEFALDLYMRSVEPRFSSDIAAMAYASAWVIRGTVAPALRVLLSERPDIVAELTPYLTDPSFARGDQ